MVRTFFLVEGLVILAAGVLLVAVDAFVLSMRPGVVRFAEGDEVLWTSIDEDERYVFDPPDWVGYAALSLGSITALYAIALPGRKCEHHESHEHEGHGH